MMPVAMMAHSGLLMIGVPVSTPKPPTLVMVMVPPVRSATPALRSRARPLTRAISRARSRMPSMSASLTLGTSSPVGVSVAIPRFTYSFTTIWLDCSSHEEFISGYWRTAAQTALAMIARGVTRTSAAAGSAFRRARSAIRLVASTVRNSVTCGIENFEATIAAAICLRVPVTGMVRSTRSRDTRATATAAGASSGSGSVSSARSTSSRVMRPSLPVPSSSARSMPRSLAYLRTGGVAIGAAPCADAAAADLRALARADQMRLPRLPGRRGLRRRRGLRGRAGAVAAGGGLTSVDADQRGAHLDGVALLGVQPGDRAGVGGGDLHHRLGGLDLDDRLVQRDRIALGHQPAHHFGVGQPLAEIGKPEVTLGHGTDPL